MYGQIISCFGENTHYIDLVRILNYFVTDQDVLNRRCNVPYRYISFKGNSTFVMHKHLYTCTQTCIRRSRKKPFVQRNGKRHLIGGHMSCIGGYTFFPSLQYNLNVKMVKGHADFWGYWQNKINFSVSSQESKSCSNTQ